MFKTVIKVVDSGLEKCARLRVQLLLTRCSEPVCSSVLYVHKHLFMQYVSFSGSKNYVSIQKNTDIDHFREKMLEVFRCK